MAQLKKGKAALKSKSVQGSVIAIVGGIVTIAGVFGALPSGSETALISGVSAVCSGVGGLWALFGSLTRKDAITSLF